MAGTSPAMTRLRRALRRFFLLLRREALVEALVVRGEIEQKLVGRKARAVFLLELAAERDERLRPHHVDPRQRAAGERREAEPEDGADIGLAHVGEHLFLEAARRLQRLDAEQPQLHLLDVDLFRGEQFLRLQIDEARPQFLRATLRIVVETLAVLAAETAALLDHLLQ